ncbi:phosphoserine phosphatase [Pseudomonas aeruginosa]|nr:phosphoserine phosphatase [Pseudomonas aeruginosa]
MPLFDLDDTLIDGDCATLWGRYMTELGWVEKTAFLHQERRLMELYAEGRLAMEDYMDFSLAPIAGRTPAEIAGAVEDFVARIIAPRIHADALRCLERHRQAGDRLLIISASAHFLVSAIGRRLGVDEVLAIDIEERDGLYTGAHPRHPHLPRGQGPSPRSLAGPGGRDAGRRDLLFRLAQRPAAALAGRPAAHGEPRPGAARARPRGRLASAGMALRRRAALYRRRPGSITL